MNIFFTILLYFLFVNGDLYFDFEKKLSIQAHNFEVDNIGNIYSISGYTLVKAMPNNQASFNYSNNFLGTPDHVDVSNPLQTLLYYKVSNVLVFLNNTLNEIRSPLKLDDISINHPLLVCSSNYNGFWIFDQSRNTILYVNTSFEVEIETQNINNIIEGNVKPNYLKEYNKEIYLNIPGKGIIEFNKNGSYNKTLPLFVDNVIQIQNKKIYYLKGDSIGLYDILVKNNYIVALPENGISNIKVQNNKVYFLNKNELSVYRIKD